MNGILNTENLKKDELCEKGEEKRAHRFHPQQHNSNGSGF
jgi:hypothetical protein